MSGRATLTMEVSRNSMMVAAITVTTIRARSPAVIVACSGKAAPGEVGTVPAAPLTETRAAAKFAAACDCIATALPPSDGSNYNKTVGPAELLIDHYVGREATPTKTLMPRRASRARIGAGVGKPVPPVRPIAG